MSDDLLRELERAARTDPVARERLLAERLRRGGRDPRHDPIPGDVIYRAGAGERRVVQLWPRALPEPVPVVQRVGAGRMFSFSKGRLVYPVSFDGFEGQEPRVDSMAAFERPGAWEVAELQAPGPVATLPIPDDVLAGLSADDRQVEWSVPDGGRQVGTLASWRKRCRGGEVLAIGDPAAGP